MPFARTQGATNQDFTGASLQNLSATLGAPVSPGALVCGHITCGNSSDFASVVDDKSNTYTLVTTGGNDTTNGQRAAMFYRENVTNGPTVFTLTFVGGLSANYLAITVDEFSGAATSGAATGTPALNVQNSPGTGANTITAPSITPSESGCLIYASTQNDGASTLASAGSGFTSATANSTAACRSEFLTHTSGAITATFGIAANESHITGVMAFRPAAGGGAAALSGAPAAVATAAGTLTPNQAAAPIADISAGSWLPSSGGSLYATLDDTSADDGDYIYVNEPGSMCEVRLASLGDPNVSSSHTLRYRLSSPVSASIRITLMQGAVQIAQWTEATTPALTTYSHALSGAEADAITDYTNLRVRLEAL